MTKPYLDPYAVLELPRTATAADIKKAYFALVRAHPPEREPEAFKRIRAAYERLRDEESRADTDMLLLRSFPASGRKRRLPQPVLTLDRNDILAAAWGLSDLAREDWREHHERIRL